MNLKIRVLWESVDNSWESWLSTESILSFSVGVKRI